MPERNVPGHTQLTRIPSRAYSMAATFASWITAALVAQYGAACDHAVSPDTDAVRMIDPDSCARMNGTAARIPLTAPSTFTRKARSQSSVVRLWIRPFGERTPAFEISTSRRPNRSVARATTASTASMSLTSAATVSTAPRSAGRPSTDAASASALTSLSTTSVSGSPANRLDNAAPSVPPAPVITTTRLFMRLRTPALDRPCGSVTLPGPEHLSPGSYEQVSAVDVEHGSGHERGRVGREEQIGAREVGRRAPSPLCGVGEHARAERGVVLPRLGERRVEPTGRDHVDGDARRREVEGEALRHADEPSLRRA